MANIKVSYFKKYSITDGAYIDSGIMAPLDVIEKLKGVPIEGTTIDIDDSCLDGNYFYAPPEAQ
jgi:hypothetical protein